MSVGLEGGCLVSGFREGDEDRIGSLRIWSRVGRHVGAEAISCRIIDAHEGVSPTIGDPDCDEILYVVGGRGSILLDGVDSPIESDMGIYVPPGHTWSIANDSSLPITLVSCRCPEPDNARAPAAPIPATPLPALERSPIARLEDQPKQRTADRWYCTLVGKAQGSTLATQFVGAIPRGRAPDHFHHYEEVICILRGTGLMWAGDCSTPIGPESCIYLPRTQVHCVENTGDDELVLLGVFYPAGSPAVRYAPESTPDSPSPTA